LKAKRAEADGLDFAGFDASVIDAHVRKIPEASSTAKQFFTAIYSSSQRTKTQTRKMQERWFREKTYSTLTSDTIIIILVSIRTGMFAPITL